MRNLFALGSVVAIAAATWLSIAPQNASACSCIGPQITLELREVVLVETTLGDVDADAELEAEMLRWPEQARFDDYGFSADNLYLPLERVQ